MNNFKRKNNVITVPFFLSALLIIIVLFRGIINNLIGYGTAMVDAVIYIMIIYFVFNAKPFYKNKKQIFIVKLYFIWFFLCALTLCMQVIFGKTQIYSGFLGFRNDVIYTFPFIFCLFFLKRKEIPKIIKVFCLSGVLICMFGIVQYLGRNYLPEILLSPKGENTFGLYGTDIIRANGLCGNTIIFSGLCIIVLSFSWAIVIKSKYHSKFGWFSFVISIVANLLTFSRASFVGMALVIVLEYLLSICWNEKSDVFKKILYLFLAIGVSIFVVFTFFKDSTIIQRLLDKDSIWNTGSDEGHFSTILNAIKTIKSNFWFGYGFGTVGYSSDASKPIIADGTFWTYLLEWGFPNVIIYSIFILQAVKLAIKYKSSSNFLCASLSLAFIGINFYLILFSIINSAYSARCNLILNFMILGCLMKYCSSKENKAQGALLNIKKKSLIIYKVP